MRLSALAEPTPYDRPHARVEHCLRRALLDDPRVIDAARALDAIRQCEASPARYLACCELTAAALADVLSAGEIDHLARVLRLRQILGIWRKTMMRGSGVGNLYGRQGARVRRGPTDRMVRLAADVLARRLAAMRCGESPAESDADRQAVSVVLRFVSRPARRAPRPQAPPTGARVERAREESKRNRVARRREQRQAQRDAEQGVTPRPPCVHDWREPCAALRAAIERTPSERMRPPSGLAFWRVEECSVCHEARIEEAAPPLPPRVPASREPTAPRALAPMTTRFECPVCGGNHSRADHPSE